MLNCSKILALSSGIFSILVFFFVFDLKTQDISIPLSYGDIPPFALGSDSLEKSLYVKTIIDNNWIFTNEYLGYPFGYVRLDFPRYDSLNYLIIKILSLFDKNYALIINLYYFLTFPLTSIITYLVLKKFKISNISAFIGSILYTFLPYHFYRGISHLTNGAYYIIPFSVMVLLWICLGIWIRDKKKYKKYIFYICLISSLTVLQTPYNGVFLCILAPVAGIAGLITTSNLASLLGTLLIWSSCLITFFIEQIPRLSYQLVSGVNQQISERAIYEVEIYSLRLSQLFLPHKHHNIEYLAKVKQEFDSNFLLINENNDSYLGLVGIFGFFALIFFIFIFLNDKSFIYKNIDNYSKIILSNLSLLNLTAFLFSTFGGFSSLFAFFITTKLRATNRIYVFIAFFSIMAACILLDCFFKKTKLHFKTIIILVLPLTLFIGLYDQIPFKLLPNYQKIREAYLADKQYIQLIESKLPKNAAIFQIPFMFYPENGTILKMADYDGVKPYLHSSTLKWSYGAIKGRQGYYWNKDMMTYDPNSLIKRLEQYKFSAILIDRYGLNNDSLSIISKLSNILQQKPIVSHDRRYATFLLPNPHLSISPPLAEPYQLGQEIQFTSLGHPMRYFTLGWSEPEKEATWTNGEESRLLLKIESFTQNKILLSINLSAFVNQLHPEQQVNVLINGQMIAQWFFRFGYNSSGQYEVIIPRKVIAKQPLTEITLQTPNAISPFELGLSNDRRKIALAIHKLTFEKVVKI